jgi:hypothetical protein
MTRVRSMIGSRLVLLLMGAVLLLILGMVLWYRADEAAARKKIARRLAELRAAGVAITAADLAERFPDPPDSDNAELLLAADFLVATNSGDSAVAGLFNIVGRTNSLNADTLEQLRRFAQRASALTNAWVLSAPLSARLPTRRHLGVTKVYSPSFTHVRHLAQGMALLTLHTTETNDSATAALLIEKSFRVTRMVNGARILDHQMRHAYELMACQSAERALNRMQFTDGQLQRMFEAIELEGEDEFAKACDSEFAFAIHAFQSIRNGASVDTYVFPPTQTDHWWENLWARVNPLKRRGPDYADQDFLRYLESVPEIRRIVKLPPLEAIRAGGQLQSNLQAGAVSVIGKNMWIPAGVGLVRSHAQGSKRVLLLKIALAMERYRLAHGGALPPDLASLEGSYLLSIPRDLFDGQPLRFKKLPRGYVIYSVGFDGVDDGGRESPNRNSVAGFDLTLTVER